MKLASLNTVTLRKEVCGWEGSCVSSTRALPGPGRVGEEGGGEGGGEGRH